VIVKRVLVLLGFSATGLAATEASAYIGPGAGISAIGALWALLAAVALAVVGLVWYPVKRLRRLVRQKTADLGQGAESKDAAQ
jgi:hypothetical protein